MTLSINSMGAVPGWTSTLTRRNDPTGRGRRHGGGPAASVSVVDVGVASGCCSDRLLGQRHGPASILLLVRSRVLLGTSRHRSAGIELVELRVGVGGGGGGGGRLRVAHLGASRNVVGVGLGLEGGRLAGELLAAIRRAGALALALRHALRTTMRSSLTLALGHTLRHTLTTLTLGRSHSSLMPLMPLGSSLMPLAMSLGTLLLLLGIMLLRRHLLRGVMLRWLMRRRLMRRRLMLRRLILLLLLILLMRRLVHLLGALVLLLRHLARHHHGSLATQRIQPRLLLLPGLRPIGRVVARRHVLLLRLVLLLMLRVRGILLLLVLLLLLLLRLTGRCLALFIPLVEILHRPRCGDALG